MSAWLYDSVEYEDGIVGTLFADADSDIPSSITALNLPLKKMSMCRVIGNGNTYQLNSAGTWVLQPRASSVSLDLTGYYTSAQVDSAIASALSGYYTSVQVDSAIASALSNYYTSSQVNDAISANNIGTAGSSGEDLNNFTSVGHRYWSTTNASSLANRPLGPSQTGAVSAQNFPIGVDTQSPRVLQMVIYNVNTGASQNRIFLRFLSSSGWSGWFEQTITPLV